MSRTEFGIRLKMAFGNASNQEIANKIGVSAPAVQNYVSGRYPDGDKLLLIAAVTKCDLHWLLTGEKRKVQEGIEEVIERRMRTIAREEISNLRSEISEPEEDVRIEPAEMMMAPVVAHIGPGHRKDEGGGMKDEADPKEDIRRSLVTDEKIQEMEKRLRPRRRKSG